MSVSEFASVHVDLEREKRVRIARLSASSLRDLVVYPFPFRDEGIVSQFKTFRYYGNCQMNSSK